MCLSIFKYILSGRNKAMCKDNRMEMKKKFLESRFKTFKTHEILEFLLHFVTSRRDNNAVAHELIDTFGGFSPIFDAEIGSLEKINDDVGEDSAVFMKIMHALMNIYENEKRQQNENKNKWSYLENFLVKEFESHGYVAFYTLCDSKLNILKNDVLTKDSIYKFESYEDKIANSISFYNAKKILISLRINREEVRLSEDDIRLIKKIRMIAESVNAVLIDYIKFSENFSSVSVARSKFSKVLYDDLITTEGLE